VNRIRTLIAAALLATLATSSAVVPALAQTTHAAKVKVGLGIIGGINDKGFNELADLGVSEAVHNLNISSHVIVTAVNGNYSATLQQFVNDHDNLVIAVGALWGGALYQIAKSNPNTHFAIVDGYPLNSKGKPVLLKNVATLQFKSEQSGYVAGVIAGLMEKQKVGAAKHNSIAALGAIPLPFIIADACGYWQGAKSVDKSVKFQFAYVGSFFDTQTAQHIGENQIAHGADILFGVADASGLGYYKAASIAHKYAIGFASDQDSLGKYMLTSAEIGIQVAVYRTIKADVQGKFKPYGHTFSIKNGGISYAKDMHHVPAKIQKKAAAVAAKLASGKIVAKPMCKLP